MPSAVLSDRVVEPAVRLPRVGFLGVGWIGRHRMEAMLKTGLIEVAALADPSNETLDQAVRSAPGAERMTFDEMLEADLDGIVIATPSALHAAQATAALQRGLAVFCQKPLGRTKTEVKSIIDVARDVDRLLGVDMSYRFTEGVQRLRDLMRSGDLGRVHAVDLVFHNAYGPDKAWFYDPALAGGGCVMDLGVHLVDLALWLLDWPEVADVSANLLCGGAPLSQSQVEDYAVATLTLASGAVVRLACSWRLPAGQDAVISASFYGASGGAEIRNIGGSFYDFVAERFRGTARESLSTPPDDWGGRAAADWARRLASGERFDPEVARIAETAEVLDRIYRRAGAAQ